MSAPVSYAAVVLAGGTSRRLGGGDKTALDLGAGRTVLDHLVSSLDKSVPVVVVGPSRALERSVRWVRESPPGGGPLAGLDAALRAGLDETGGAEWVVLLAGDQPFAGRAVDALLAARTPDADAVLATDPAGRAQPLLAAYRRTALTGALAALGVSVRGGSMHALLDRLIVVRVEVEPLACLDIDDDESLHQARQVLRGGSDR